MRKRAGSSPVARTITLTGEFALRRDVGFYVEAPVQTVYQAYLNAATHEPFERDCKQEPFFSISFGVNFSFKYNMNGGACTLHFMPYGTGTAVNMRFSVAQLAGARYERYAEDLNRAMQAFLPVIPRPAQFNVDDFDKPENQVRTAAVPQQPTPVTVAPPVTVQQPQTTFKFCTKCGNPLPMDARFCSKCGNAVPVSRTCPSCGVPTKEGASFCTACGTRL